MCWGKRELMDKDFVVRCLAVLYRGWKHDEGEKAEGARIALSQVAVNLGILVEYRAQVRANEQPVTENDA